MDASPPATPARSVPWAEVSLFFAVACLVSAPFRLHLVDLSAIAPLPWGLGLFFRVLRGIGPAVGYFVVRRLLKSKVPRTTTFWGRSRPASLCAMAVIPAGLAIAGVANSLGLSSHYYGLLSGVVLACYALGEEYGWRGYLQQALAPLALPLRVFVIGTLWYAWHLNFLVPQVTLASHAIHFAALLLGAWGLLKVTDATQSILFAAAVHLSFNILSDVDIERPAALLVLGAAAIVWIVLVRRLRRQPAIDPGS